MQNQAQVSTCQAFCQAAPAIGGPANICSADIQYQVAGLPAGATVEWRVASGIGVIFSTTNNILTIRLAPGQTSGATATLVATISSECGQFSISRSVEVGSRLRIDRVASGGLPLIVQPTVVGYTNLQWVVDGQPSSVAYDGTQAVFELQGRSISVVLRGTNLCTGATSTSNTVAKTAATSGPPCMQRPASSAPTATLYPNPARETVDVHIDNPDAAQPITVRLFDGYGQLRAEQVSRGQATLRLKTDQLPAGLYFVHLLRGSQVVKREQLRIEK